MEAAFDFDRSVAELMPYLRQYNLDEDIFEDITGYQIAMLRKPFEKEHSVKLKYDFPTYFANIYTKNYQPLQKKKTTVKITPNRSFKSFEDYSHKTVWFGRRKEVVVYKKDEIEITYE